MGEVKWNKKKKKFKLLPRRYLQFISNFSPVFLRSEERKNNLFLAGGVLLRLGRVFFVCVCVALMLFRLSKDYLCECAAYCNSNSNSCVSAALAIAVASSSSSSSLLLGWLAVVWFRPCVFVCALHMSVCHVCAVPCRALLCTLFMAFFPVCLSWDTKIRQPLLSISILCCVQHIFRAPCVLRSLLCLFGKRANGDHDASQSTHNVCSRCVCVWCVCACLYLLAIAPKTQSNLGFLFNTQ